MGFMIVQVWPAVTNHQLLLLIAPKPNNLVIGY